MNEQQSLQVLKQVLNVATQKGCFESIEAAGMALQAFNIIAAKMQPQIPNKPVENDKAGVNK